MNDRIESILNLNRRSSPKLEMQTLALLKDPYATNLKEDIEQALTLLEPVDSYLIGALNFFLFTILAEHLAIEYNNKERNIANLWSEKKENDYSQEEVKKKYNEYEVTYANLLKEANAYLKKPQVIDFIVKTYSIGGTDELDIVQKKELLQLHKVGTTSYIFKIVSLKKVIKCIKLRYIDNPTILQNTENYKKQFEELEIDNSATPEIYSTTPTHIIMEFIVGKTLREYIKSKVTEDSNIMTIEVGLKIWSQLCTKLKMYAECGVFHLDLSPENILITKSDDPQLYLIDFGFNYLLGERIGNTGSFMKAQLYMAPELIESRLFKSEQKILADIYSLGIILLEMLSDKELTTQDIQNQLDRIRNDYSSGLGQILEDMIDRDVETRVFEFPRTSECYDLIKEKVSEELKLYSQLKQENSLERIFKSMFHVGWVKEIIQLSKQVKYFKKGNREKGSSTKKLLFFTTVAYLLNLLCLTIFVVKVADSIHYNTWKEDLPGYLVAASFSITFIVYYLNIFGLLDTNKIDKVNQFSLQIDSVIAFLPVLYALLINPEAWAYCSAVGVFIVALNNTTNCRLAIRAGKKYRGIFTGRNYPVSYDDFIIEIKAWRKWMLIYGFLLLVIAILTYSRWKILNDVWAYALFVVVINFKMAIENSITWAPYMRNNLTKAILWFEKANAFEQKRRDLTP